MKLLAFDTSSTACSIAISNNGKIISHHEIAPMQQAKMILPLINELVKSANLVMNQLDGIAFGCGPGSFTGVRIAVSVAQGLAFGIQKPLVAISSLAATAQAAYEDLGWSRQLVAIDARMNEVYWALYEVQKNDVVTLTGKEQISRPEEIILPDSNWCGIGDAWEVYQAEIPAKAALIDTNRLPTATAILRLAQAKFQSGDTVTAADARPVYLRNNVAKKSNPV